jgi:drug/metabolite transporter (DMT)-like permease
LGYLYCFGAFILIGSYNVPTRFSKSTGLSFLPMLGGGLLIGVLLFYPTFFELTASPLWLGATYLSGLLWCLGQCAANIALDEISLAKGAALFNVNTLINLAAGLLLFGEGAKPGSVPWIVSGGLLLFAGAVWVAWAQAVPSRERNFKKGLLWSLVAAFFWGVYFLPIMAVRKMDPQAPFTTLHVLVGLMAGGGLSALAVGLFPKAKPNWIKDFRWGALSAFLWAAGTGFFLMGISSLGLSKTVPMVNTNVLMYAIWSLFIFKELPISQAVRVLGGCLTIAVGIALIAQG